MTTKEDLSTPGNMLRSLEPFRSLNSSMPLQCVSAFMLVACDEGQNVTEYARRAGVTPSLMTRHLSDIGTTNRHHLPGLGLVEQVHNVMDRRERLVRLTAKGPGIVGQIVRAHK